MQTPFYALNGFVCNSNTRYTTNQDTKVTWKASIWMFDTYCVVVGSEMLQSQEVLVEKTLGKAIEDNNVHPLYVLLVTEMAPTAKKTIPKRSALTTWVSGQTNVEMFFFPSFLN